MSLFHHPSSSSQLRKKLLCSLFAIIASLSSPRHSSHRMYSSHTFLPRLYTLPAFVIPLLRPVSALAATSSFSKRAFCPPRARTDSVLPFSRMSLSSASAPASAPEITGPAWDLASEYHSFESDVLENDVSTAISAIESLSEISAPIVEMLPHAENISLNDAVQRNVLQVLAEMYENFWAAARNLSNVSTFASCVSSVDGTHDGAKKQYAKMQELRAKLTQAFEPASLFLDKCSDEIVHAFCDMNELTKASTFSILHSRKFRDHILSLAEENLHTSLAVTGHSAWSALYTDLSSVLIANVPQSDASVKRMGVAAAAGLLDSPEESVRRNAWEAIRDAWLPHQETCAAVLNAIVGWRLASDEKRNMKSFLATSLHMNRMTEHSLTALFEALDANSDVGKRALRVQALALGKKKVDLWDFFAPAPRVKGRDHEGKLYTFSEGIELIANAVGEIDSDAADFVRMMQKNKWIEASKGDKKRPGAYCARFLKSRNPIVYLSDYNGRSQMLLTLAHELGHAYHEWLMRKMPLQESFYPLSLAESASIFFETVVAGALLKRAQSPAEKFSILWTEAESAATFLLNIPARFRFEEQFNIRRKQGKLSAKEIDDLMVESWRRYYGDSVNDLHRVGVFSQSKLHFYMTGISFYNFPYSFGYLFALGVYAEYEKSADAKSFSTLYRNLLRDTGRMEAEKVVEKHLGGRIDSVHYWNDAIGIVRRKVEDFEEAYKMLQR